MAAEDQERRFVIAEPDHFGHYNRRVYTFDYQKTPGGRFEVEFANSAVCQSFGDTWSFALKGSQVTRLAIASYSWGRCADSCRKG